MLFVLKEIEICLLEEISFAVTEKDLREEFHTTEISGKASFGKVCNYLNMISDQLIYKNTFCHSL